MSSREKDGKFVRQHSLSSVMLYWFGGIASGLVLFVLGRLLASDLAAFRSCAHNDTLSLSTCGKQGLNGGDWLLMVLCVLAGCAVIGFFTLALTYSRRIKRG